MIAFFVIVSLVLFVLGVWWPNSVAYKQMEAKRNQDEALQERAQKDARDAYIKRSNEQTIENRIATARWDEQMKIKEEEARAEVRRLHQEQQRKARG